MGTTNKKPNKTSTGGGVDFDCIEPPDLGDVAVVAQSLDNQWVPRRLLGEMLRKGYALKDVKRRREKFVRAEYLRSLINARQVVINRAYIYNNPVVFNDYLRDYKGQNQEKNRNTFKGLLNASVIVPFLFGESSPVDAPAYKTDIRGFEAWQEICQETHMKCLRLSWEEDNSKLIREQLGRRFHSYAQSISAGVVDIYLSDLKLPDSAKKPFLSKLNNIAKECLKANEKQQYITREHLYSKFITADNSINTDGKYDSSKPFSGEIKQLLDLNYNINLPDVIGGYALTPSDSLPRASLQEFSAQQLQTEVTAELLYTQLKKLNFDLIQRSLCPRSIGSLSLSQIQEIRNTDEWVKYIASLENLLENPLMFADDKGGASDVYKNYIKVTKQMANLVASNETIPWSPTIEFVVSVAGAVFSYTLAEGGLAAYNFSGEISAVVGASAPFIARLVIRGLPKIKTVTNLVTHFDFMRGKMPYPRTEWKELQKILGSSKNLQIPVSTKQKQNATINNPEYV